MNNFTFHNPTRLLFGKGMIEKLSTAIPMVHRIMITFGGGSVKQNGVYDQVIKALKDRDYIEFWGIEPNPTIETLREAIQIAKGKQVDFLLAVGGGSVIDGTKLISAGIQYDGDPWELVQKGYYYHTVPMGTVLTLPATGSEMNSGAVISRKETQEKFPFYSNFPVFSILDPETTFSLPPYQVSCGIADTFVHVMEQYMTTTDQSRLMDHWAESILSTLVEIAPNKSRKTKSDGREKRKAIFEAKTKCAQKSRLLPPSGQNTSVVQTPFKSCLNDAFLLNFLLKYHLKPIANLAKNRIFT